VVKIEGDMLHLSSAAPIKSGRQGNLLLSDVEAGDAEHVIAEA
jgi:hypothetical protein